MSPGTFSLDEAIAALDSGATLVVPNNRLRKALLEAISLHSASEVIACPRVEAVDVWVRMTWQRYAQQGLQPFASAYVLDGVQEQLIWTRIVEESMNTFPLLNPQETARALSHAYQLMKQWQMDAPTAERLEQFSGIADVAAFLHWRERFIEFCAQQHCLNLVDAIALLSSYLQEHPINEPVLLVNFYQPPPLYSDLFATCSNARFLHTVSDQHLDLDGIAVSRHEYPDADNEIAACARWAVQRLEDSPEARIAVVCASKESCAENFQQALRDSINPRSLIDFEDEAQFISEASPSPIARTALIKDALLLLGLHNEQQQADELCRLLRSPYLAASDGEREQRLHMEQFMRRRFSKQVSWKHFSDVINTAERDYHCPSLAAALLQMRVILRAAPARQTAANWLKTFAQLLEATGWPGHNLSTSEQQTFAQWQSVLEQFADSSALLGELSVSKAVEKLRSLCQQTSSRQTGTGPAVHFYSPTEAAGLQFDHLWLLGFTDQNWPAATAPTPFLPYELQKHYGLPGSHSEIQYQAARSTFTVLCNSTSQSIIASHALGDGDQEFRASSLTMALAEAELQAALPREVNDYFKAGRTLPGLGTTRDTALPELQADDAVSGGQGIISDQSACPFRAFANYRLRIRQLEDFESGLNARDRGSAIHEALEHLYQQIGNLDALQQLSTAERESHCLAAANVAADYLYRRHRDIMTPRFRELETQRISELLLTFLDKELERGEFVVTANEATIKWQHRALQLTLRIDRIDQLGDNSLAIIDYKTGKKTARPASWLQERSEDMQLPVYAVASSGSFTEPVSALCLAHINVAETSYTGLAEHDNFHRSLAVVDTLKDTGMNWQALNEFFATNVRGLADDFVDGVIAVDPVNGSKTCTYCGLESLCRINEKRRAAGNALLADEDSESND